MARYVARHSPRRVVGASLAAIVAGVLAGCGSGSLSTKPTPTASSPPPTTAAESLHATYVTLPTKGASPTGVALDAQGTVWTTEEGGDAIARVTSGGRVSEIKLPRPGAPGLGIVRAPDGSMWFTDRDANEVDRIATNGSLLRVPLEPGSTPLGICSGPLDSLWVTENGGNAVDRITPTGQVMKAADLGSGAAPVGIVEGPDGNLWVAESDAIARVTPAGVVTQYALSPGVGTLRIVNGTGSDMWFVEERGGRAGRVDTTGHITLLAASFDQPTGIAVDNTGTVWIAEQGAGTIDHVSSQGNVVRYKVDTTFAQPEDLAGAPDGTMWFSEFGGGEVGRFATAHPST
jgi:virginiamycin B lyase